MSLGFRALDKGLPVIRKFDFGQYLVVQAAGSESRVSEVQGLSWDPNP